MPEEERRISPAVILIPVGLGLAGLLGIFALAWAAPPVPPEGYICPYCGATFDTFEDLVSHVQIEHPGERIPIHIIWQ